MNSGTALLAEMAFGTVDANGNATVMLGPARSRDTWQVKLVAVDCAGSTEALCSVYVGPNASAPYLRDTTLTGASGDSTDAAAGTVRPGEYVTCVWSGATPGTRARMVITGSKLVAG